MGQMSNSNLIKLNNSDRILSDFIKNDKKIKNINTYCSLIYKYCLIYYFMMMSYQHIMLFLTNQQQHITKAAESAKYWYLYYLLVKQ